MSKLKWNRSKISMIKIKNGLDLVILVKSLNLSSFKQIEIEV